ncbi:metallophosphoesterase [Neobacillus vireti]|uniref:metallophosphoesterase n=1 Tax=Neobacillus vireti TaxID=220686 RepID=UPI002FFEBE86
MDIWLTSDTHFDHINIMKYEPSRSERFKDNIEMTEKLIENWNKEVKTNDLIFHLGDVFFCKADRMKEISDRLNGRKILIRGNHDKGYSNTKFRNLGFEVYNYYFIDDFVLSHYPQNEAALKVAIDKGLLRGNIHGHVHSQIEGLDQSIYKCVSVELTDFKPITLFDVKKEFIIRRIASKYYKS